MYITEENSRHMKAKLIFTILTLSFMFLKGIAQESILKDEKHQIIKQLLKLKINYEEAIYLQENHEKKVLEKKFPEGIDSLYSKYQSLAKRLKNKENKKVYLDYINKVLASNDPMLEKAYVGIYTYINPLSPDFRPNLSINLAKYYKIVKYSLYERNKDILLPLNDIPFMQNENKLYLESRLIEIP